MVLSEVSKVLQHLYMLDWGRGGLGSNHVPVELIYIRVKRTGEGRGNWEGGGD